MIIVIDTNVIKTATDENNLDTMEIIIELRKDNNLKIGLDFERVILKEYEANCKNELYKKWIGEMHNKNKVEFQDGKISNEIGKKLTEKGFHEANDKVFVAVALKTDKNIITEDSDYGKGKEANAKIKEKQAVLKYMTEELELNIMDYEEGKTYLGSCN
jgi:predicted nucleic acid-binding protein